MTKADIPDDLYQRAYEAYRRRCNNTGAIFQEPEAGGDVEGDTISLQNRHGVLARFRWTGKKLVALDAD